MNRIGSPVIFRSSVKPDSLGHAFSIFDGIFDEAEHNLNFTPKDASVAFEALTRIPPDIIRFVPQSRGPSLRA